MILSSHQPNFLPYMGFFYKAYKSDAMALSVDVAFSKKGRHNWNFVRTAAGSRRITLPVHAHHDTPVSKAIYVDLEYNLEKSIKGLLLDYRNAPNFNAGVELIEQMRVASKICNNNMAEFNIYLIKYICERFDMKTKLFSTAPLELEGHKDDRIWDLCQKTGANVYLSGEGARVYHIPEGFKDRGIELRYSQYTPIHYQQMHGDFIENLSVVDYIFNQGFTLPKEWV